MCWTFVFAECCLPIARIDRALWLLPPWLANRAGQHERSLALAVGLNGTHDPDRMLLTDQSSLELKSVSGIALAASAIIFIIAFTTYMKPSGKGLPGDEVTHLAQLSEAARQCRTVDATASGLCTSLHA